MQKIFTLAGNGYSGYSGDGGTAPSAELDGPICVALDSARNVYFVDYYNNRVRKVAPVGFAGTITTVVGNGNPGYTGDGTIATTVDIIPHSIAFNRYGDMYVCDENSSVIRKVNHSTQIITTIAGAGVPGYSGDGGSARLATFKQPYGIAVDKIGNVYVADAGNHVVRKIDTAGMISTFAGNGTAGYSGNGGLATAAQLDSPYTVAVDRWGAVYITDYVNNVIRKVDTFNNIYLFAGTPGTNGYTGDNGIASAAELNNPKGIAVDTFGNLFIADADNAVIREVNTSGIITTVVGNGTIGFGGDFGLVDGCNLHNPYGVAVDVYGNIYIADANNQRIRETYSPWLAVNNVTNTAHIEIYPNPAANEVTVTGCSLADRISVWDITGREVTSEYMVTNSAETTISIGHLEPGLYLLQVRDNAGNKVTASRIVKE